MSNCKPLCSVIIPAYNCAPYIRAAVLSALAQTWSFLEILIIDDCSTDDTPAILSQLAKEEQNLKVYRNEHNMGVAETRNRGVSLADGDWVALLDSDDIWLPDKLERQFALLFQTGGDLCYTGAEMIDASGAADGRRIFVPPTVDYEKLLCGNDIICSSVLIRKSLLAAFPMHRSDLHEDFITWAGMLKNGCRAVGLDLPLLQYRITSGSKSHNKMKSAQMTWNSYKEIGVAWFKRPFAFFCYICHGIKRYRSMK